MNEASISALWQQTILTRRMDMIADNLANASTPGFKNEMLMYQLRAKNGALGPRLVEAASIARDSSAGSVVQTGNQLDVAIQGDGYFAVETPLGERFTRNGRFSLDAEGRLVTSTGHPVLGDDGGPIFFAPTESSIQIGADGTVSTVEGGEIATIGIVKFADDNLLRRTPEGFYAADAVPEPAVDAKLAQGFIEESNVQPVLETVEMMQVLRDFRAAQTVIQNEHERETRTIRALTGTN